MSSRDPYQPPAADLAERPSRVAARFRLTPVLVSGIVIDLIGSMLVFLLLAGAFGASMFASGMSQEEVERGLLMDPGLNWTLLIVGFAITTLAGFVAARWAGTRHTLHAIATGTLVAMVAFPMVLAGDPEESYFPFWINLLSCLLMIPLAGLGGLLARPSG